MMIKAPTCIVCVFKPAELIISVAVEGTEIWNLPSASVAVPLLVCFTTTLTAGKGAPLASVIFPEMVLSWASSEAGSSDKQTSPAIHSIIFLIEFNFCFRIDF